MPNKEIIENRVTKLQDLYKTRFREAENPRADPELRTLRKKLKRAQRKFRLVLAAEKKEQNKSKTAE